MIIRNITADELADFAEVTDDPQRNTGLRWYLRELLKDGYSRPAWLFIAEEGGQIVGRASYWSLPNFQQPQLLDILYLPTTGDYLAVGTALLDHSLAALRERGAEQISYELDRSPLDPAELRDRVAQNLTVIEMAGFRPMRQTRRFQLTDVRAPISLPSRLNFRNLREVGEQAFIDAIVVVGEGSLDRSTQQGRERHGARAEASEHFMSLQGFKYEPGWWQLAYLPSGELAGLIVPAKNDGGPIIAYIGVVPQQRGNGYVDDLLAKGTATLIASGAWRIRADTDTENAPMAAAFRRAGYVEFATRAEFSIDLTARVL